MYTSSSGFSSLAGESANEAWGNNGDLAEFIADVSIYRDSQDRFVWGFCNEQKQKLCLLGCNGRNSFTGTGIGP